MRFIIFLIFHSINVLGQDTSKSFSNDKNFILNKIKTAYAGYESKSKIIKLKQILKKVNLKKTIDTFEVFSKITLPFKDHHLKLFEDMDFTKVKKGDCDLNLISIANQEYNHNLYQKDGYWINHLNNIIIYLKHDSLFGYNGYLIESKKNIPNGFRILRMYDFKNGKFITDYISIQNKVRSFLYSTFKNDSTLSCSSYAKWNKISNYQSNYLLKVNEVIKLPSIDISDTNNVLIKMPSFNPKQIKIYDSLINVYEKFITNTKNLIIDLRNNSGGVINCFYTLLPFICTKSIMRPEFYQLVSNDLIEDIRSRKGKVIEEKDTSMLKRYEEYLKGYEDSKGKFKFIPTDTLCKCNKGKENHIKNIALIINNRCMSAAELMILAFKQSSKVKIFGENSGGAIDFLDVKEYVLPQSKYILWVAMTKRKTSSLLPSYDEKGISPDIEIKLEEKYWVDFVKKYYEKN